MSLRKLSSIIAVEIDLNKLLVSLSSALGKSIKCEGVDFLYPKTTEDILFHFNKSARFLNNILNNVNDQDVKKEINNINYEPLEIISKKL
jgi:hypothetical protein